MDRLRWRPWALGAALVTIVGLIAALNVVDNRAGEHGPTHRPKVSHPHVVLPAGTFATRAGWSVTDAPVVSISPTQAIVRTAKGPLLVVPLDRHTQICRGSCRSTWRAVSAGDLVDAYVVDRPGGRAHAKWVDINVASDWAQIDAIDGNSLVVHSTRHPWEPHPRYGLIIGPDTIIEPTTPHASETVGRYRDAQIGDEIYFTGATATPGDLRVVFATRVFPPVHPLPS
jgi:hypothetical protein